MSDNTRPPQPVAVGDAPQRPARRRRPRFSVERGWFPPLGSKGKAALVFSLLTGVLTHGYHLFRYPLYLTDEGIYMQRAWSLVRETSLSPYTYDYDHAPMGWITLAGWVFPLPSQFETFGNAINTGRFLMLLVHVASVYLLFEVTRRLSGSVLAATVAAFFFNVSPLAVYFQRQVLLDNLMMFWLLLSLFVLLRRETTIRSVFGGGLALGIALITKENAVFFVPTFMYLLYRRIKGSPSSRFTSTLWPFAAAAPIGAYVTYALLKNELMPSSLDFDLNNPPADHVSLLYTLWWQLNRNQGTLLSHNGLLHTSWLPRDGILLVAGLIAMVICLFWGLRDRKRNLGFLIAGTLAFGYSFYLLRGSVVLDFYITPLIPMFAMNIGMVVDRMMKASYSSRMLQRAHSGLRVALPSLVVLILLAAPSTGYLMTVNTEGVTQIADQYQSKLNLTGMQHAQIAWVRKNVPTNARIVMDDDLWGELHDVRPFYPYAHSHWNASSDPDLRDKLFKKKWQNIDYIIMSNKMRKSILANNADGRENWILQALRNSDRVWSDTQGDIKLEIYRVQ
ncbi:glycosyltransferase family 39 protein [Streptomyces sp. NEAU-Y11]|uniref:glycosyltransferase family 39 protein n=1 Tax=Streptomyces cucumeris TaxID=2962890 RepID=UPI0020C8E22B|nr:glycosyltransferase family 39 protein [Streptomyces sp. NEAU-Y11]MCP9207036.1 glycosyltransferase family 39 protein [Streptomyces sp. NEAU-Y11]